MHSIQRPDPQKVLHDVLATLDGERVVVAVSGGVDSMALLHAVHALGHPLVAAHVNHGLRGADSDADRRLVETVCARHDIELHVADRPVEDGGNRQDQARTLRYAWFEEVRRSRRCGAILTAHHLDDRIEGLILHLTRGTGTDGLRGLPRRMGRIVRPWVDVPKDVLRAYAAEHDIAFREDVSNADTTYQRNRVRHDVVPILRDLSDDLHTVMGRFFARIEDVHAFERAGFDALRRRTVRRVHGADTVSRITLRRMDGARTFLFHWLHPLGFDPDRIDAIHAAAVGHDHGQVFEADDHRLFVERRIVALVGSEVPGTMISIGRPRERRIRLDGLGDLFLRTLPTHAASIRRNPLHAILDADALDWPLTLRPWRPGDYLYPFGLRRDGRLKKKKVKALLNDAKVPAHERERIHVLCSGDRVVWVVGMRPDGRFTPTEQTETALTLVWRPAE